MTLIHIILVNPQKYPCMIGESKILCNSILINLLINKLFMTLNGLEENLFQINHILQSLIIKIYKYLIFETVNSLFSRAGICVNNLHQQYCNILIQINKPLTGNKK